MVFGKQDMGWRVEGDICDVWHSVLHFFRIIVHNCTQYFSNITLYMKYVYKEHIYTKKMGKLMNNNDSLKKSWSYLIPWFQLPPTPNFCFSNQPKIISASKVLHDWYLWVENTWILNNRIAFIYKQYIKSYYHLSSTYRIL